MSDYAMTRWWFNIIGNRDGWYGLCLAQFRAKQGSRSRRKQGREIAHCFVCLSSNRECIYAQTAQIEYKMVNIDVNCVEIKKKCN